MSLLKNLLIIFSFLFITHSDAMESLYLASWVNATSHITVTTVNAHINVTIKNDTTVLDVKNSLKKQVGASVEFQALCAVWLRPETCFLLTGRSEWLQNNQLVKRLMHNYHTDQFELYVPQRDKIL